MVTDEFQGRFSVKFANRTSQIEPLERRARWRRGPPAEPLKRESVEITEPADGLI